MAGQWLPNMDHLLGVILKYLIGLHLLEDSVLNLSFQVGSPVERSRGHPGLPVAPSFLFCTFRGWYWEPSANPSASFLPLAAQSLTPTVRAHRAFAGPRESSSWGLSPHGA